MRLSAAIALVLFLVTGIAVAADGSRGGFGLEERVTAAARTILGRDPTPDELPQFRALPPAQVQTVAAIERLYLDSLVQDRDEQVQTVVRAYRAALRRDPSQAEAKQWMERARSGAISFAVLTKAVQAQPSVARASEPLVNRPASIDVFTPSEASPGSTVTLSGQARPGTFMSTYLAGQIHVGVAQVDARGNYALTFRIPPNAPLGEAFVQTGCDNCGNGWRRVGGLRIVSAGAAPAPRPPVATQPIAPPAAGPSAPPPILGTIRMVEDNIIKSYQAAFGRGPDEAELKWWKDQVQNNNRLNDPEQLFALHMNYLRQEPSFQVQTAQRALMKAYETDLARNSRLRSQVSDSNSAIVRRAISDLMAQREGGGYRGLVSFLAQPDIRSAYLGQPASTRCDIPSSAAAVGRFEGLWEIRNDVLEIFPPDNYRLWAPSPQGSYYLATTGKIVPFNVNGADNCSLPERFRPAWQMSRNAMCLHDAPEYGTTRAERIGIFGCSINSVPVNSDVEVYRRAGSQADEAIRNAKGVGDNNADVFSRGLMEGSWPVYAMGQGSLPDKSAALGRQTGCLTILGDRATIVHSNRKLQGTVTLQRGCGDNDYYFCTLAVWINGRQDASISYYGPYNRRDGKYAQLRVLYNTNDSYFNTAEYAERKLDDTRRACQVPQGAPDEPPPPPPASKKGCEEGKSCEHLVRTWTRLLLRTPAGKTWENLKVEYGGQYTLGVMGNVGLGNIPPQPVTGTWTSDGKTLRLSGHGEATLRGSRLEFKNGVSYD